MRGLCYKCFEHLFYLLTTPLLLAILVYFSTTYHFHTLIRDTCLVVAGCHRSVCFRSFAVPSSVGQPNGEIANEIKQNTDSWKEIIICYILNFFGRS